jgi:3-phenylpropionate/cinnamic acid dioxygenase small subunit
MNDETAGSRSQLEAIEKRLRLREDRQAARSGTPPSLSTSMHNISNVLIELDGDVARCESYSIVIVRIRKDGGDVDWLHAGRYVDRFERRNGEWRIAYRTVVYDVERFR